MSAQRSTTDEQRLLADLAVGDREAFGAIFDLHVEELRRFAAGLDASRIDAVLREAFLDLWRHAARLDPSVPLREQLLALVVLHGRAEPVAA